MSTLRVYQGKSATYDATCLDQDDEPLDLTDMELTFTVASRATPASPVIVKTVGDGITVTDPSSGIATVTLDPADTDGLPALDYRWDLDAELDGNRWTLDIGLFMVKTPVTLTEGS